MKTIKTWLPLFPGFCNTHFEPNYEQLLYEINNSRENKGLNEIEDIDLINFDNEQYEFDIIQEFAQVFKNHFNDFLNTNIEIKLEEIKHPREYNFHNDSGNIVVWLDENDLLKIQTAIYKNRKKVGLYLEKTYTSGSGFMSFYSNKFTDWEGYTNKFIEWNNEGHHLGAMMQALFQIYTDRKHAILDESYDFLLFEEVMMDKDLHNYVSNYDDCMESNVCFVCQDEFVNKSWREEYNNVCSHYEESWKQMTNGQKLPEFYSFEDWMKKQNTYENRVCADCIDTNTKEEIVEYLNS